MKKAFNILTFIVFTVAAIYVGGYVMFIGGIIQTIDGIKSDPVNATDVAFGIAKFMFAGFVGYVIFYVGLVSSMFSNFTTKKIK